MTSQEFNEKYKEYLEEGHYGLAINIPSVIKYLDEEVFPYHIKMKDFKYSQIKLKFDSARVYFKINDNDGYVNTNKIEEYISRLAKEYYQELANQVDNNNNK